MLGILKLIAVSAIGICCLASIRKSSEDMFMDNILMVCQGAEELCIRIRYRYHPKFRFVFGLHLLTV